MYPRFGMAYTAIYTAQARAHAALLQQDDNQAPQARTEVLSKIHDDEVGVLLRTGGVIAVILAVAGVLGWLVA